MIKRPVPLTLVARRGPSTHAYWRTPYVSGIYGACLREVTPEAMVAKEQLIWRIDTLTANARLEDDSWVAQLREAVDALDSVERPFTDYDRQRWGGTSRDSHITAVRETYL